LCQSANEITEIRLAAAQTALSANFFSARGPLWQSARASKKAPEQRLFGLLYIGLSVNVSALSLLVLTICKITSFSFYLHRRKRINLVKYLRAPGFTRSCLFSTSETQIKCRQRYLLVSRYFPPIIQFLPLLFSLLCNFVLAQINLELSASGVAANSSNTSTVKIIALAFFPDNFCIKLSQLFQVKPA